MAINSKILAVEQGRCNAVELDEIDSLFPVTPLQQADSMKGVPCLKVIRYRWLFLPTTVAR